MNVTLRSGTIAIMVGNLILSKKPQKRGTGEYDPSPLPALRSWRTFTAHDTPPAGKVLVCMPGVWQGIPPERA